MLPNPQETADLVTFAEEILNRKLHFVCSNSCLLLSITVCNFQSIKFHLFELKWRIELKSVKKNKSMATFSLRNMS